MKLPHFFARPASVSRIPAPLVMPALTSVSVDLQYHLPRSGGDFFDVITIDTSRLVFLLMDIAGQRDPAMNLAAYVQDEFRGRTPELFTGAINEAESLAALCLHLSRTILTTAGRANMAAAFLGVLNDAGVLTYINAGHVPGLLILPDSYELLVSTGLPLGLFSHTTHEAAFRVLPRDGALVMVSRGVVEAATQHGVLAHLGHNPEFGAKGLISAAIGAPRVAQSLCRTVLDSALAHASRQVDNDLSVAAISRNAG